MAQSRAFVIREIDLLENCAGGLLPCWDAGCEAPERAGGRTIRIDLIDTPIVGRFLG